MIRYCFNLEKVGTFQETPVYISRHKAISEILNRTVTAMLKDSMSAILSIALFPGRNTAQKGGRIKCSTKDALW